MSTRIEPKPSHSTRDASLDRHSRTISRLVDQLRRENEIIAQLMDDRQRLRRELLAAQEQQLRAVRDSEKLTHDGP